MLYWVIEVEQMKLKKSESEMLCAFEHIDMEFAHYKCCIIIIIIVHNLDKGII